MAQLIQKDRKFQIELPEVYSIELIWLNEIKRILTHL